MSGAQTDSDEELGYPTLPALTGIEIRMTRVGPVGRCVRDLCAAVRALAVTPRPCFCAHGVGNPMLTSHTAACEGARLALLQAELMLRQYYTDPQA